MSKSTASRLSTLEAEYTTRQLILKAPIIEGWRWTTSHRRLPLPFYEDHSLLPAQFGYCRICAGPVFKHNAHFGDAISKRAYWHAVCLKAFTFWSTPDPDVLGLRQNWRCNHCGEDLASAPTDEHRDLIRYSGHFRSTVQVDHVVPLYRVWRDMRGLYWTDLIRFWSSDNLQVLCIPCHQEKSASETTERAKASVAGVQLMLL
jgi:hypothetical protein